MEKIHELFFEGDINHNNKNKQKIKNIIAKKNLKKKKARYDSGIFIDNNMKKKKVLFKRNLSVKSIEFSFPTQKVNNFQNETRKILRLKGFHKNRSSSQIMNYTNIPLRFLDVKNKSTQTKNMANNQVNIINKRYYDIENNKYTSTYSKIKNTKSYNNIYLNLNKNSDNEKEDIISKVIIPQIESDRYHIEEKLPIKTLRYYHNYLFHHKNRCNCKEAEEKGEINMIEDNLSQSCYSGTQQSNNICEYDTVEFEGKKKTVITKLTRSKTEKKKKRYSKSLKDYKTKEKKDYHYIMKHPFSNINFCNNIANHLTDNNNNSYTNNFSEKYKNLDNPLKDKDFTDKLRSLVLNPNTSKIRNWELLSIYKNFPKGTFYNIYNNSINKFNEKNLFNEELKKLENTKYRKYLIKLNESLEKAKNIQKQLNTIMYINKNSC